VPNDHTMARSMPRRRSRAFPPADESLVAALMKSGIITTELLQAAQRYGAENHRDLRQSILELNLISTETLNTLAFQHLAEMVNGNGAMVPAREGMSSPSRPTVPSISATSGTNFRSSPPPRRCPSWSAR